MVYLEVHKSQVFKKIKTLHDDYVIPDDTHDQ